MSVLKKKNPGRVDFRANLAGVRRTSLLFDGGGNGQLGNLSKLIPALPDSSGHSAQLIRKLVDIQKIHLRRRWYCIMRSPCKRWKPGFSCYCLKLQRVRHEVPLRSDEM